MKSKNKKSIFHQVMSPGDWLKLIILLVFFVSSWFWVWKTYTAPIDQEVQVFFNQSRG